MNNLAIAACVVSGSEAEKLTLGDEVAEKTKIVHEGLEEKMKGVSTKEEAQQFANETGANFYIAGEDRDMDKEVDEKTISRNSTEHEISRYSNSRNRNEGLSR